MNTIILDEHNGVHVGINLRGKHCQVYQSLVSFIVQLVLGAI